MSNIGDLGAHLKQSESLMRNSSNVHYAGIGLDGKRRCFRVGGNVDLRSSSLQTACTSGTQATEPDASNAAENFSVALRKHQAGERGVTYDLERTQVGCLL